MNSMFLLHHNYIGHCPPYEVCFIYTIFWELPLFPSSFYWVSLRYMQELFVPFIVDIMATDTNFENKTVSVSTRSLVYHESACTVS
jgi:hypothetical protein